ncbi:Hypothetical predicted protein [Mytilus galloprovincialis]|uniref:Uncharacterized protein n=1 Tax=Mytilus galloprovincialis TaxID=29158 RepID=A0A8B6ENJ3_MYTGA|nr:Hypothetical predicted protein [Mytilus galloprovincialis]
MGTGTLNMDNSAAQSLITPIKQHFKSDFINHWDALQIDQVRVSVYKNGTERAFFLFNGVGSSKTNWFSQSRLLNTSYTDLGQSTTTNYFSINGHTRNLSNLQTHFFRRFFINAKYGGCCCDTGWVFVSDIHSYGVCDWEHLYLPQKPFIIFSPKSTRSQYSNDSNDILADTLAIFVKLDSYECPVVQSSPVQLNENTYCYVPQNISSEPNTVTKMAVEHTTMAESVLQDKVTKLKQELTVTPKSTKKYLRSIVSAPDERYSSRALGILGGVIISGVVSFFVFLDIIRCLSRDTQ